MKRWFVLICIATFAFLLAACAPVSGAAQGIVELPSPIQLAILAAVTFAVGWLFTQIAVLIPQLAKFLGQYVDEVSVAIAGALVLEIQNLLGAIPPEWEGVANAALALIVAVLAALGLFKTLRKARVPGFK